MAAAQDRLQENLWAWFLTLASVCVQKQTHRTPMTTGLINWGCCTPSPSPCEQQALQTSPLPWIKVLKRLHLLLEGRLFTAWHLTLACSGLQFTKINIPKLLQFSSNLTTAVICVTLFLPGQGILFKPLTESRSPWRYLLLCEWHILPFTPLRASIQVENNNFHFLARKIRSLIYHRNHSEAIESRTRKKSGFAACLGNW